MMNNYWSLTVLERRALTVSAFINYLKREPQLPKELHLKPEEKWYMIDGRGYLTKKDAVKVLDVPCYWMNGKRMYLKITTKKIYTKEQETLLKDNWRDRQDARRALNDIRDRNNKIKEDWFCRITTGI